MHELIKIVRGVSNIIIIGRNRGDKTRRISFWRSITVSIATICKITTSLKPINKRPVYIIHTPIHNISILNPITIEHIHIHQIQPMKERPTHNIPTINMSWINQKTPIILSPISQSPPISWYLLLLLSWESSPSPFMHSFRWCYFFKVNNDAPWGIFLAILYQWQYFGGDTIA